jgi:hypothetical protein
VLDGSASGAIVVVILATASATLHVFRSLGR